jgi:hypothetical protein
MDLPHNQLKLSLEQEFNHKVFIDKVRELSAQEAKELLIQLHTQMLYKENVYKELLLIHGKEIVDSLFSAQ